MNGRLTISLVVTLAALGGYVFFSEPGGVDVPISTESGPIHQKRYGEYDISELEIQGPARFSHFTRTDNGPTQDWQMMAPDRLPPDALDQVRVNGSASRLARLQSMQVITSVRNLTEYGLETPALTATLTLSNGQKIILFAGDPTPLKDGYYLQLATAKGTVYLVQAAAVTELDRLLTVPPLAPTPLPAMTPAP